MLLNCGKTWSHVEVILPPNISHLYQKLLDAEAMASMDTNEQGRSSSALRSSAMRTASELDKMFRSKCLEHFKSLNVTPAVHVALPEEEVASQRLRKWLEAYDYLGPMPTNQIFGMLSPKTSTKHGWRWLQCQGRLQILLPPEAALQYELIGNIEASTRESSSSRGARRFHDARLAFIEECRQSFKLDSHPFCGLLPSNDRFAVPPRFECRSIQSMIGIKLRTWRKAPPTDTDRDRADSIDAKHGEFSFPDRLGRRWVVVRQGERFVRVLLPPNIASQFAGLQSARANEGYQSQLSEVDKGKLERTFDHVLSRFLSDAEEWIPRPTSQISALGGDGVQSHTPELVRREQRRSSDLFWDPPLEYRILTWHFRSGNLDTQVYRFEQYVARVLQISGPTPSSSSPTGHHTGQEPSATDVPRRSASRSMADVSNGIRQEFGLREGSPTRNRPSRGHADDQRKTNAIGSDAARVPSRKEVDPFQSAERRHKERQPVYGPLLTPEVTPVSARGDGQQHRPRSQTPQDRDNVATRTPTPLPRKSRNHDIRALHPGYQKKPLPPLPPGAPPRLHLNDSPLPSPDDGGVPQRPSPKRKPPPQPPKVIDYALQEVAPSRLRKHRTTISQPEVASPRRKNTEGKTHPYKHQGPSSRPRSPPIVTV